MIADIALAISRRCHSVRRRIRTAVPASARKVTSASRSIATK
ncbi:hypothetical protein [Sphingomonas sp. CCH9-F2]|nr:hypothetical protein [Sphingomonas sp. CCH9-F2]